AQKNPLFVAVDDVERLDVESRNLIALLAERAPHHPLLFAVARCKDSELECDALRLIDATSSAIEIQPLRAAEVHTLLASVFGEVPHLQALSDRLYDLTNGNPRWLMQLAKHLVDQDVVKHQRGAWTLPENTSEVELPRNMAEATAAIVNHLSPAARALAEVFGLAGVDQYFELANIVYFSGGSTPISLRAPPLTSSAAPRAANGPPAKPISLHAKPIADAAAKEALLVTLTELTIASLLVPVGGTYRLAGREWIEPLVAPLSPRRERALHEQLAEIFRQRGDGPRQAFHLLRAGRHLDGIDALARFAEASCALTDADADAYLRFLENTPDDWRAIYGEALARAVDHPRRKQVEFAIRTRLLGILVHSSGSSDGHLEAQMHALAENAGLDILASLDPSVAAGERIKRAIGQAVARYGALPENEKVVDPMAALQALARAMTTASGHVANSMDFEMWRRLPSLRSVAALAPALSVVNMLAEGADARFAGRFGESGRIFEDLLSKLVPPNDMGLAPSYASGIRVGVGTVVGLYAAQLGDKAWETRAAEVAIDPIHASNALLVRALGELWQGDVQQSDRIEGERKLLRLEHRRPQAYEGLGVLWRFMGYVACDDLTRTRQGLDEIERFSKRSTTWEPAAIWARAEYERMRGAPEPALIHVDHALTRMRAGGHLLWASAATTRLLILTSLDRAAEALSDGERYLAAAREVGLDHQLASLYLATACAAAKQADASCAWAHLASAMAVLERYHAGGVRLGLAFEAAASAAIYLRDSALFEQYEARCRELYCVHENRTLAAKHERLRRAAIRAGLIARTTSMRAMRHATDTQLISKFEALLETCADPQQAIERTLQLIVADASARAGYLYTLVDDESVLLAHAGGDEHWEDGRATARTLLIAEHDEGGVTEDYEDEASSAAKTETATNAYQSVVVGHQGDKGFVVRGVMMLLGAGPVAEHTMEIVRRLSRYLAISEP
ncbi:MAG TPA: hypothetical protein VGI70_02650, partial [Polyangiales bacterium]